MNKHEEQKAPESAFSVVDLAATMLPGLGAMFGLLYPESIHNLPLSYLTPFAVYSAGYGVISFWVEQFCGPYIHARNPLAATAGVGWAILVSTFA